MLFKYGKQRGYLLDWVMFHARPHVYSALERDTQLTREYIKPEEQAMPVTRNSMKNHWLAAAVRAIASP